MYYQRHDKCDKCDKCVDKPGKDYCNTACGDHKKNCYESYKVFNPKVYAKVSICNQPYENLFTVKDGFKAGTIFKDLYDPYCAVEYSDSLGKGCK